MTEANPGIKGKDMLVRGVPPLVIDNIPELASLYGVSRNEWAKRALREAVGRDMADPIIRPVLEAVRTLRQGLK